MTLTTILRLILLTVMASGAWGRTADVVLSGTLNRTDHESYVAVPFDVPAGTQALTVHFDYDRSQRTTIDLGLEDPTRFRGWSGGNKRFFTVSEVVATPSYLPGPLPAGRWHLILGVPNLREGVSAAYRASIHFERGREAYARAFAAEPLRDTAGWYRGDLHAHSGHSDGACVSRGGRRAPCPAYRTVQAAAARGLDFVALTEHNARSHFQALAELQPHFDDVLLLSAREVTTFDGHFNAFGTTGPVDFRASAGDMASVLTQVAAQGGLVSINHPGLPSGEACMGCGWRADGGLDHVTAVEVVNGGTLSTALGSVGGPLSGLHFWERQLAAGRRLTAVAGSDNHDPDLPPGPPNPVGQPSTVIYAEALSQAALLEGLRSGRVFIDVRGSSDGHFELTARAGARHATMGGVLPVTAGEDLTVTVIVGGVADAEVALFCRTESVTAPAHRRRDQQQRSVWTFDVGGGGCSPGDTDEAAWIRAEVRDASGDILLLSNPIYLSPASA